MFLTRKRAYARAGLLGNPSDGYHGKTISFSVRELLRRGRALRVGLGGHRAGRRRPRAVRLGARPGARRAAARLLRRHPPDQGHHQALRRVLRGAQGIALHDRNFSVRYQTNIPRQVGLAGSSAIIVATLRCLMEFYEVEIPLEAQPTFVLGVEQEELGITAGLQDRVIQVYEGLVYMDFDKARERVVAGLPCYHYERARPGAAAAASTSRITSAWASRPRCSTTTSASASTAERRWWWTP